MLEGGLMLGAKDRMAKDRMAECWISAVSCWAPEGHLPTQGPAPSPTAQLLSLGQFCTAVFVV